MNLDAWMGAVDSAESRAADAWARIQDKPASVVLVRKTGPLPAQTLRVEYDRSTGSGTETGDAGTSSKRGVILFGIRGHASLPDTDIQRGDRFAYQGYQFKVVDLVFTIGEVQATAEAQS